MLVVGLTLLALAVRLVPALSWPLWHDEAETWLASRASATAFLNWLAHPVHPPLSFALVRLSTEILGTDAVWALRLPAVLAGALAVPAAYHVGKLGLSRRFGVGFAGLLAVSPTLVLQGRTARMYPIVVLAALVTFACLLRLENRDRPGLGETLVLGLAFAFAVGSHYLGLAVWLGAILAVLVHARGHRTWGNPLIRGVALASLLPAAVLVAGSGPLRWWAGRLANRILPAVGEGQFARIQNVPVPEVPAELWPWALAGGAVLAGLVAVGMAGLLRLRDRRPLLASLLAWTAGLSLPIALAGGLVLILAMRRYLILIEVAILAGIAAFAFQRTSRGSFAFGLALFGLMALVALDPVHREPWYDVGEVVERVAERRDGGESVWYYPCYLRMIGHYHDLPPGPPPWPEWTWRCSPEWYPPAREPATWLIVGHTFPDDAGLRAVVERLEEAYEVASAYARIDDALGRYAAVAARFERGRVELIHPARPSLYRTGMGTAVDRGP